jgi:hypothetical protein
MRIYYKRTQELQTLQDKLLEQQLHQQPTSVLNNSSQQLYQQLILYQQSYTGPKPPYMIKHELQQQIQNFFFKKIMIYTYRNTNKAITNSKSNGLVLLL